MGGGGSSSQKVDQVFNMTAINESIYREMNTNITESAADQSNMQSLEVVLENVKYCKANFVQTIKAETQSISEFTAEQATEIQNAITSEMQAQAGAQIEKAAQMGNLADLGLGGDSSMEIKQTVNQTIKNTIVNEITTENINRSVATQVNIQDGKLTIRGYECAPGDSIDWNQDIVAVLAAQAVTNSVRTAFASTEVVNKLAATTEAEAKKKDGGIAEAAEGIGQGFANVAEGIGSGIGNIMGRGQMASAASACVLCIAILAALYFMMSPAGQGATKNFMKKR